MNRAAQARVGGSSRWIAGTVTLGTGLAWLLIDRLLRSAHPLTWGGPNFGRGALLLLAYAGVVVGVALLTGGYRSTRAARRTTTLVVDGLLLVALVVTYATTDTDRTGINGAVGLTLGVGGRPVLVLEICRGSVDEVDVVGPNVDGRNQPVAKLTSSHPVSGTANVDPSAPPTGWSGTPAALETEAGGQTLLIATANGRQSVLRQVTFTAAELRTLTAATVLYTDGSINRRVATANFHDVTCS